MKKLLLVLLCLSYAWPVWAQVVRPPSGMGGSGSGNVSTATTLTAQQLVMGNDGSSLIPATTATFSTSLTGPLIIGGTGTTSTLTVQTTTGAGGTSDAFVITGGNAGATTIAKFWGTGAIGIGRTSAPLSTRVDIIGSGLSTSGTYLQYIQHDLSGDLGGLAQAGSSLRVNALYSATNPNSAFTGTANAVNATVTYGFGGVAAVGTVGAIQARNTIIANGDQNSEQFALAAYVLSNVGAGAGYGQTTAPAGSIFGAIDIDVNGPIALQPGLLTGINLHMLNTYNGSPSRSGQKSNGIVLTTSFGLGAGDAPHAAATTYPLDAAIAITGTSGSATPGATNGWTIGVQCGGVPGNRGGAGAINASLIGTCADSTQYTTGLYLHGATGGAATGVAILVDADGGGVAIGTTFSEPRKINVLHSTATTGSAAVYGQNSNAGTATTSTHGLWGVVAGTNTSGTQSVLAAMRADATFNGNGGTSNITTGLRTLATNTIGTTGELSGIYVAPNSVAGGTVNRNAGINIEAQTGGTAVYGLYSKHTANHLLAGNLQIGSTTQLTLTQGAVGLAKITASASAPGASGSKLEVVCGTNAGTAKLIMYAGTSGTAVTVLDNVGAGVTGC